MQGWNNPFWMEVGLGDLVADRYQRIGVEILEPGTAVGNGLTEQSANNMGLNPGIAIATSLIDAHAGGIGIRNKPFNTYTRYYIQDTYRYVRSKSGKGQRSVILSSDISTGTDWWNIHMPHGCESPWQ